VEKDKASNKDYLLCDYNRDGDSYRSPWSNTYDPPIDDGAVPSDRVRLLEEQANAAFDTYRELYFEGGVSSAYLWDLDHGFAGVILIKKSRFLGLPTPFIWKRKSTFVPCTVRSLDCTPF
jgi:capping protein beta